MTRYFEDDLLPLSALQHLAFCERQCALIHIEQAWEDNVLTVLGGLLHEKVHSGVSETRESVRTARGVRLRSLSLGLTGIADVVEFHLTENDGCLLPGRRGRWLPYPVEYKRGRPKGADWDEVQLCAQAECLEEMLDVHVTEGALYYGQTKRRVSVLFTDPLRDRTRELSQRLHVLITSGKTPPPSLGARCRSCSLQEICRPQTMESSRSVSSWIQLRLEESAREVEA